MVFTDRAGSVTGCVSR